MWWAFRLLTVPAGFEILRAGSRLRLRTRSTLRSGNVLRSRSASGIVRGLADLLA